MGAQLVCFTSESQRAWAQDNLADPETLVVGCVDGALKSWFDTRAMGVVFLRPDRFVAAACLAQEAGKALASLRTAMHATPVAPGAVAEAADVAGDVTDAGAATLRSRWSHEPLARRDVPHAAAAPDRPGSADLG